MLELILNIGKIGENSGQHPENGKRETMIGNWEKYFTGNWFLDYLDNDGTRYKITTARVAWEFVLLVGIKREITTLADGKKNKNEI